MKTVLQMIIDQFKDNEKVEFTGASVVHLLEMYLPNEKKQIIDAVKYGQNNHSISITHEENMAKNYYNETFNIK